MKPVNKLAFLPLLTVIALSLLLPFVAVAQDGTEGSREVTADEVNAISSQLYCPVCENIPLDVCGTAACARWREQVRSLLTEGKSEDEVIGYFVEQFGERVVGTPQDPLLNFLSWVVPLGTIVIGLGVVGFVLVRWRTKRHAAPADKPHLDDDLNGDDDYRARLEHDLKELE